MIASLLEDIVFNQGSRVVNYVQTLFYLFIYFSLLKRQGCISECFSLNVLFVFLEEAQVTKEKYYDAIGQLAKNSF